MGLYKKAHPTRRIPMCDNVLDRRLGLPTMRRMITKHPTPEETKLVLEHLAYASGRELVITLMRIDDSTIRLAENALHYTYRDREIQQELENNG